MSLFQPFPNYVWNLSVAIALENGGRIGEIMDMMEPLKAKAEAGEDAGTPHTCICPSIKCLYPL